MNINAANALLKSLEEPPPKTIFLILSSEPGRLLTTIRSRCRRMALEGLGPDDLRRAARQAYDAEGKSPPDEKDLAALEPLAGGSVRRMLSLAGSGGLVLQAKIEKLFAALPSIDAAAAHQLADDLAPAAAEQKFELFFDLLLAHFQRLIRAAAAGEGTASEIATANRLIGPMRVAGFAQLWETLARDKTQTLALNLDKKSLVLDCLSRIEAAARS
jgi:DNA polymerase III subunit delta'